MRVYFDDLLSATELHAARLDGHLVALGLGWVPADAVPTPSLRAGSLAPVLGEGLAAVGRTAAWIHGALDEPPSRIFAQRAVREGGRRASTASVHVRDVVLPARDQDRRGGVRVSTPARTLVDLTAESLTSPAPETGDAMARLLAVPGLCDDAIDLVRHRARMPHRSDILRTLEGQDDVTR